MSDDTTQVPAPDLAALAAEREALVAAARSAQEQLNSQRSMFENERAQLQAQLAELQKAKQAAAFDPKSVLTAEEVDAVDPSYLEIVSKVSRAAAEQERARLEEQLKQHQVQLAERYRSEFLQAQLNTPGSGLEDFSALAVDPKFDSWLKSDAGAAANAALVQLINAPVSEIPKLVRRAAAQVEKYSGKQTKQTDQTEDPTARLARHASRRPGPQAIGNDVMRKVKQLAASRNPADRAKAAELLASAA
jgi:hypothetical protein